MTWLDVVAEIARSLAFVAVIACLTLIILRG